MVKFSDPKHVRKHVRYHMGLAVVGPVGATNHHEFERRCKELCAENGWDDWEVS